MDISTIFTQLTSVIAHKDSMVSLDTTSFTFNNQIWYSIHGIFPFQFILLTNGQKKSNFYFLFFTPNDNVSEDYHDFCAIYPEITSMIDSSSFASQILLNPLSQQFECIGYSEIGISTHEDEILEDEIFEDEILQIMHHFQHFQMDDNNNSNFNTVFNFQEFLTKLPKEEIEKLLRGEQTDFMFKNTHIHLIPFQSKPSIEERTKLNDIHSVRMKFITELQTNLDHLYPSLIKMEKTKVIPLFYNLLKQMGYLDTPLAQTLRTYMQIPQFIRFVNNIIKQYLKQKEKK